MTALTDLVEKLVRQAYDAGKTGKTPPAVDRDEVMKVDAGEKTFTIYLYLEREDDVYYFGFNGRRSEAMDVHQFLAFVKKLRNDFSRAMDGAIHGFSGQNHFLRILMKGDDGEEGGT